MLINQPRQSQLKSNSSSDNRKLTRLNPSKRRFGYASSAAAMEQFAVKFYGFFTKANRSAFANVCCAVCDAVAQLPVKLAVTIIANSITRRLYAVMLHFITPMLRPFAYFDVDSLQRAGKVQAAHNWKDGVYLSSQESPAFHVLRVQRELLMWLVVFLGCCFSSRYTDYNFCIQMST